MTPGSDHLTIRSAGDADWPAMVDLAARALGWPAGDPNAELLDWKHHRNPFGRSPAWVAEVDSRLVGIRIFMRWAFDGPDGPRHAVRAVDTATDPAHQGRGVFSALTRAGVDTLTADGVDFVFNTPNDQSRPGYLKMGWQVVGRVPIAARPNGPRGLWRMARARVPAAKWSVPTSVGEDPVSVLTDDAEVQALLASQPPATRLTTARSPGFLQWRYGFGPLHYRACLAGSSIGDGVAFFRCRTRGRAVEATVTDVIAPEADAGVARRLLARVARVSGADYAVAARSSGVGRAGFVLLPGQGPIMTWRALADDHQPPLDQWRLTLGDIELF